MKFFFFLVVLALLGIFLVYRYQESHPGKGGLFSYNLNEKETESTITPPSTYKVLEARSADRFVIVRNNTETQNFHLVGLVGIPSDGKDIFECGKSADALKALNKEALDFANSLIVGRSDLHIRERDRQHKDGELYVEGDILLTNGVSFSEMVMKSGYAKNDPGAVTDYDTFEKEARRKEKGIWSNSLPPKKRFKISSNIRQKGLNRDAYAQKASMTSEVLEKVASEERVVYATFDIFIQPPITRNYDLQFFCDFTMDEVTGVSDDTGDEVKQHKGTEHIKEKYTVTSVTTNVTLKSSPYEMSRITRGGRTFRQGVYCSGCVCRVFFEGEEIYSERKDF